MVVVDRKKLEDLYLGLVKGPGSINGALKQPSRNENGEVVKTQSLCVEHEGVRFDLELTCTNVTSCRITNGKMPLQVRLPDGNTAVMMLDIKEAGGHIGGWVRTTGENFALLEQALVAA